MIKQVIARVIVFFITFLGGLFYFNYLSTAGKTEMSAEMNQATLPVLYIQSGDQYINEMHGYTGEMDESMLKDTLTPVENNKQLSVYIKEYDNTITSLQYELLNVSGNEVIEKGTIKKLTKASGGVIAKINWKKVLTEKKDYTLKLTLKPDGGVATNYYTRVRYREEFHLKEYFLFYTIT